VNLTLEEFVRFLTNFWLNFGESIVLISTISIILVVFAILLGGKYEEKWRFFVSIFLIIVGIVLTTIASPFSKEWNSVLIGALFTPLIAYLIDILRTKQKFSNEKDKLSYDYRWKQVERESDIIGELLGELSTHAAAFKSYGTQEIEAEKWRGSFRVGLISDIHTLSIARYYYFVPKYNVIIKDINELTERIGETKMKNILEGFSEVKKAFLETETEIFLTLIYDLGLLQQNYLARPTVKFPLHMGLLLRKRLEKFGIVKENEEIEPRRIFSNPNLERFNLKVVTHLNFCYATIGLKLKAINKMINEIKTSQNK
jgi:hypothetical protein